MIASRRILIADRVARVSGNLRANFEHHARREISGAVFAGEPIGCQGDFLVERLLESELSTAAIRVCRHHVSAEEIAAESDSRTLLEVF